MAGSRFRGRHVQRGKFLGGVVRAVLRNVPRVVIKTAKAARPLLTKQGLKTLAKKGSILAAKKGAEYAAKQAVEKITERRKRGQGLRFKGRWMQRGSGGVKLSKKLASVEKTRRRFSRMLPVCKWSCLGCIK